MPATGFPVITPNILQNNFFPFPPSPSSLDKINEAAGKNFNSDSFRKLILDISLKRINNALYSGKLSFFPHRPVTSYKLPSFRTESCLFSSNNDLRRPRGGSQRDIEIIIANICGRSRIGKSPSNRTNDEREAAEPPSPVRGFREPGQETLLISGCQRDRREKVSQDMVDEAVECGKVYKERRDRREKDFERIEGNIEVQLIRAITLLAVVRLT